QAVRFANGGALSLDRVRTAVQNGEILRVCGPDKHFLGLGQADEENRELRVLKLFPD
ncbi:MAG: pseudouridine synthase, partial [Clostridiales bacterium]|nr:pseudouridine synthase [Clostridiales bacterium]